MNTFTKTLLSLSLISRLIFGGLASADPARGWAYCHEEHSDVGNYGVLVEEKGFIAKRVRDRDTRRWAWHIETKEGEVIGDEESETESYVRAAMVAQTAYFIDTHGVSEPGQTLSEVLNERADTFYNLVELNDSLSDLEFAIEIASQLAGLLVRYKLTGVSPNYSELENEILRETTQNFMNDFERYLGSEGGDVLSELSDPPEYFEEKLESFAEERIMVAASRLRYAAQIVEKDRELWSETDAEIFLECYTHGHIYGLGSLTFLKGINEHRIDWRNRLTSFVEDFVKGGTNINLRDLVKGVDGLESIFRLEPNTFADFEREVLHQSEFYEEFIGMYNPWDPEGAAYFYLGELRSQ